ncbi:MAG: carboxypeptidase regulatory-like domain-containing protein, partial [Gemmatimonadetes bacterium]|nr:carboxypeptidase regulatory-like domain-containing protein [Gemmatimonadota bacterium]
MKRSCAIWLAVAAVLAMGTPSLLAQGVTTASISGVVNDARGNPVSGANILAVHRPSGTSYTARTRADGRVSIPGMRTGGPYRLTVAYIG